jgi:hypothetical protein
MALTQNILARQARKLFRKPQGKTQLQTLQLEDRAVPAVSGFAYQDYNANGNFDTSTTITNLGGTNINNPPPAGTVSGARDVGYQGLTVRLFNSAGNLIDTQTTGPNGAWSSNATTGGQQYRVEYSGFVAGSNVFSGPHGTSNATSVQFVTDGEANANLGVVRPQDYYPAVPLLVTPLYTMGGQNTNAAAIISFPYSGGSAAPTATSADANNPRADISSPQFHDLSIPASQVGTTWGLAFNRSQANIFASSFTKRHSNWRPGNLAGNTTPGAQNNAGIIYTMDQLPPARVASFGQWCRTYPHRPRDGRFRSVG